jgi:hypothetical protein
VYARGVQSHSGPVDNPLSSPGVPVAAAVSVGVCVFAVKAIP